MRFRGGGIGHRVLCDVEHRLAETDPWVDIDENTDVAMQYGTSSSVPIAEDGYGSDIVPSDEDDEDANIEDEEDIDLGAEDGEMPADIGEAEYGDL